MSKKITVSVKKSATGPAKTPAKGQSIAQNIASSRLRVISAIRQNEGNVR